MSYQIKYVEADLFSGIHASTIAHGCNTKGAMGAGVAKIVRDRYPNVYETYRDRCNRALFRGGSALLVGIRPSLTAKLESVHRIFNLGTQIKPGADAQPHLIATSFTNMALVAEAYEIKVIGIPRIGCGIGGLEWYSVLDAIELGLKTVDSHLTILVHDLPGAAVPVVRAPSLTEGVAIGGWS